MGGDDPIYSQFYGDDPHPSRAEGPAIPVLHQRSLSVDCRSPYCFRERQWNTTKLLSSCRRQQTKFG